MLALSEATISAAGVIVAAMTTGGFALAGIVITMRRQKEPLRVEPRSVQSAADCDGCAECKSALIAALAELEVWKQLAEEWKPRRRADD